MKKALVLLLALMMCLSLAACGGGNDTPTTGQNEQLESNTPSTEETPTETTVPETTAEPEPVYETIELTADNLWQYLEIVNNVYWYENDFGDVSAAQVSQQITYKKEYESRLDLENSKCIVEVSFEKQYAEVTIDADSCTYTIGETLQTSDNTLIIKCSPPDYLDSILNSTSFSEHSEGWFASTNPEDYKILRIEGTLYIQTN